MYKRAPGHRDFVHDRTKTATLMCGKRTGYINALELLEDVSRTAYSRCETELDSADMSDG